MPPPNKIRGGPQGPRRLGMPPPLQISLYPSCLQQPPPGDWGWVMGGGGALGQRAPPNSAMPSPHPRLPADPQISPPTPEGLRGSGTPPSQLHPHIRDPPHSKPHGMDLGFPLRMNLGVPLQGNPPIRAPPKSPSTTLGCLRGHPTPTAPLYISPSSKPYRIDLGVPPPSFGGLPTVWMGRRKGRSPKLY